LKSQTEIVRIINEVKEGEQITSDKIEIVKVGEFNLPPDVIRKSEDAIGKYAKADFVKGDYILNTKVSNIPFAQNEYLTRLNGTKQAMSVTIKTFAAGLSGKLASGDVISIISADFGEFRTTVVPPELQYVEVLAVTSDTGEDKEYNPDMNEKVDEKELPSTITLLVTQTQAKILAELEAKGKIHTMLVYRGNRENVDKFIKLQDEYLGK
jgi:pilus assembly protein CpaB